MSGTRRTVAGAVIAALLLTGCGESLSGTYEREDGTGSIEFDEDGTAYVTMIGLTFQGEYEMDGDRVIINGPGGGQVYTMRGDRLEGGLGMTFVRK